MKIINWIKIHRTGILVSITSVILAFIICGLMSYAIYDSTKEERYLATLSPEEKQAYINKITAEEKLRIEANISRYEVLSVFRYIKVETNDLGGVTGSDICYTFEYIDSEGTIHSIDGFENLEHGTTKVIVGDTNMYIVDNNEKDTYRYLQLTKETIRKIEDNKRNTALVD